MADLPFIITWWLTITLIGFIFLPLTTYLFNHFIDKGYIFSKILGILLSSYIVWLLGSLNFLPFVKITIFLVLVGFFLLNLFLLKKLLKDGYRFPLFWILLEEIIFFATLYFWSYVRGCEPSIRGLEKFMDFGFVNSILRANYFPPLDMWLTKSPDYTGGYHINYYYFGHYVTAFLTKLSGIDSAITYNLMIATLFAFTFSLSFSIGANFVFLFLSYQLPAHKQILLKRKPYILITILIGFLAAFLVSLGGNLHTLYIYTTSYPLESPEPPWKLGLGFYPDRYWYPNATRFIPFTIHEFPIYSFVVADLHGHVSDIPFVLLTLALLLSIVTWKKDNFQTKYKIKSKQDKESLSYLRRFFQEFQEQTLIPFPKLFLLGILLASMYMTNAWDGIIYMILAGFIFLYLNLREEKEISVNSILYKTASASLFLVFFFLIFSLPFSLNFKPFVSGIGVLCAPSILFDKTLGPFIFEKDKCQKSPFWMLVILWGFFYYNVLGYLYFVVIPRWKTNLLPKNKILKNQKKSYFSFFYHIGKKIITYLQTAAPVDILIIIMILVSSLLLIFPEFFYMKDIYPAHYRANTMFKLGYQAFIMLGLVSSFIIFRVRYVQLIGKKLLYKTYQLFFILLFSLVAIYPYFAINSYYGGLRIYHGLDGLKWLLSQYPEDYEAILWLRKNILCKTVSPDCNNQPVIVEANGDSYSDYARVSANTGLPTIVGWPVHEWLWRGSYDEAGRRIPEVATIYESKNIDETKDILRKYNVEYIFIGSLEREKYKNLDEKKLESLGKTVFENGKTKILKVSSSL